MVHPSHGIYNNNKTFFENWECVYSVASSLLYPTHDDNDIYFSNNPDCFEESLRLKRHTYILFFS